MFVTASFKAEDSRQIVSRSSAAVEGEESKRIVRQETCFFLFFSLPARPWPHKRWHILKQAAIKSFCKSSVGFNIVQLLSNTASCLWRDDRSDGVAFNKKIVRLFTFAYLLCLHGSWLLSNSISLTREHKSNEAVRRNYSVRKKNSRDGNLPFIPYFGRRFCERKAVATKMEATRDEFASMTTPSEGVEAEGVWVVFLSLKHTKCPLLSR